MSEIENNPEVTDAQSARKEIEDFIQHINQQNYNQAEKSFKDMVGGRLGDMLDQQKAKLAGQIFTDVEPDMPENPEDQEEISAEEPEEVDLTPDDFEEDDFEEEDVEDDEETA